jgi:hypothetical protein
MSFPTSPIDGQIVIVNNVSYTYDSANELWYRNGQTSANVVVTDTANIVATTASTSTTTGALRVAGGIGVVGNIYAGNFFYANGAAVSSAGGVGYTGSAGAGSTGYTGSAGTAGSAGSVGYTGSSGSQGSTGYTGSASTAVGYTGSRGTNATNTTSATAPASPTVGDIWYNTTRDVLLRYTDVGIGTSYWLDITGPITGIAFSSSAASVTPTV